MSTNSDESDNLMRVRGIGPTAASRLSEAGIKTIEHVANAKPTELSTVKGIGIVSAEKIIGNAKHLMTLERGLSIVLDHIKTNFVKNCPKCGGGDMQERFIILGPKRGKLPVYQCAVCRFYLPR